MGEKCSIELPRRGENHGANVAPLVKLVLLRIRTDWHAWPSSSVAWWEIIRSSLERVTEGPSCCATVGASLFSRIAYQKKTKGTMVVP